MAQMTEAACLLHSGALYSHRRGLRSPSGVDIFIGVKPGGFSIYFGDEPIFHFDLDGRWQRAFVEGIHYLKGLDTTVQAIDRVRAEKNLVLHRRTLPFAEAVGLDERIRSIAIDLGENVGSSGALLDPPHGALSLSSEQIRDLLDRVSAWDSAAWFAHRELYLATYGPLPFLPPDTPSPVILQATLGHARGVGFGGGVAATYYERSPDEFREHTRDVARLLGRRVLQCRQVFLAGPDALRNGPDAAVAALDSGSVVFPIDPGRRPRSRDTEMLDDRPALDGFHAFLHEFDGPPFPPEAWSALRERHFRRLILGVESGSPAVRAHYGRAWDEGGLRAWVESCPVGMGMVIVVGAGGRESEADHLEETLALVASLPIPAGSLVSLVDANELEARTEDERGFPLLDPPALARQRETLKTRLAVILSPRKAKVTTYSVEKRWN